MDRGAVDMGYRNIIHEPTGSGINQPEFDLDKWLANDKQRLKCGTANNPSGIVKPPVELQGGSTSEDDNRILVDLRAPCKYS